MGTYYYEKIRPPYANHRLDLNDVVDSFYQDTVMRNGRDRMIVIGGANLVLRGIIDHTPDIDVLAPTILVRALIVHGLASAVMPPRTAIINGADNISARYKTKTGTWMCATDSLGDGHYPMSYDSVDEEEGSTEVIRGIRCLSLGHVIESKKALSREKDVDHLKSIDDYLRAK